MIGTMRWWAAAFIAVIVTSTLVGRPIGLEIGGVGIQTYDVIIVGVLFIGLLSTVGKPSVLLFVPFIVVLGIEWDSRGRRTKRCGRTAST